ncbi:calcium-binding protein, partial [Ralstonia sp. 1138]|uniref:calcium-binding protein n=1 Tax=Ralstonia sp. 1138 TaxID=3156423 RepID=UPI0033940DF9
MTKTVAGTTTAVGTSGRYLRIYHTDATNAVGVTGMKVFSGGVDVAAGRASRSGVDSGSLGLSQLNNPNALTDGSFGGSWNGNGTPATSNMAYARADAGAGGYIELDLGSVQNIDAVSLWGRTDQWAYEANNLRVFVSDAAFGANETYASLSANTGMARVDVGAVTGNATDQYADTVTSVENVVGTVLDDTLIGDINSNFLCGGEGNDTINGGAGDDVLYGGAGNDTINGGDGNDKLAGGLGVDTVSAGAGDDLILQDIERSSDRLDGGAGNDTVDYSVTTVYGNTGISADLTQGKVTKTVAGTTTVVGETGRYIRIYSTTYNATVSLTGMKVYAGSVDVAAGKATRSGVDSGSLGGTQWNNVNALTDGNIGGSWN